MQVASTSCSTRLSRRGVHQPKALLLSGTASQAVCPLDMSGHSAEAPKKELAAAPQSPVVQRFLFVP